MKNRILSEAVIVATLLAGMGNTMAWAQHGGHGVPSSPTQPAPVVRTGKAQGKVVEFSQNSITVETSHKGKTERVICLIDGHTKTKGDLQVAADVVVKYREESGAKVATNIEVKKTKQPGA